MTHVHDPHSRLAVFVTTLSCDPTTDGWTVSTPQRHLPTVPTLTLIKKFGTFSPAWSPPLDTAHHHVHHLSWSCVSWHSLWLTPCSRGLYHPLPGLLPTSPHLSHPLPFPPFPSMGTCHCCFNETTPTTAEGQNLRSWVTYHSLASLEDFLMWELETLQYDAITVCFPSRHTTQPNSLVSLKPNSIRHLIMLRKYIHHLVQDSHLSVSSDATDHALIRYDSNLKSRPSPPS